MATIDRTSALAAVEEKVLAGERLDLDDGVAILESDDILTVGRLADTRAPAARRHATRSSSSTTCT